VTKGRLGQGAISHPNGEGVLDVGAPLGGRRCLQALKEAHGLLPNLLDASDLD
jgi:hypothetical protein